MVYLWKHLATCTWFTVTCISDCTGNGGDASIQDETRKSPLHRLAILSHDVHMFKLLCENGANINSLDCRGNSPLLSLCDLSASEMYDYMEDLSPCSNNTMEDTCASLSVKRDYLNFVLQHKDVQVAPTVHMLFCCILQLRHYEFKLIYICSFIQPLKGSWVQVIGHLTVMPEVHV